VEISKRFTAFLVSAPISEVVEIGNTVLGGELAKMFAYSDVTVEGFKINRTGV